MLSYRIDNSERLICVGASGLITVLDMMTHIQELHLDSEFDPSFNILITVLEETFICISTSRDFLKSLLKNIPASGPRVKLAFDCPDGTIKAFLIYHFFNLDTGPIEIDFFTDRDLCLEWLEQ